MSTMPTALVVGGSGAVGLEICAQLLTKNLRVVATCTSDGSHRDVEWIRWKVGQAFRPGSALEGSVLQAIFYCVGSPSSKLSLLETTLEEVTNLYAINACGFLEVLGSLKDTIRRSATSIIAISSDATTSTRRLNGPYTASKFALEVFARTIAIEEQKHGVRANVVCPSLIDSPMGNLSLRRSGVTDVDAHKKTLPGGRALSPGDVARVAISLAFDPQWAGCSGQVYRIGGPPR